MSIEFITPVRPPMPSRQKISAVLRKAGFKRSVGHTSGMVRGWKNYTPGYVVEQRFDGSLTVRYRSDMSRDFETRKRRAADYLFVLGPLGGNMGADGTNLEGYVVFNPAYFAPKSISPSV